MSQIIILYEGDHEARAETLRISLINKAKTVAVTANPYFEAGLETLMFWGHGDKDALCGKPSEEIIRIIRAWKTLNKGLQTIEILTCNSAHWKPFEKGNEPKVYLKSKLAHFFTDKRINNSMGKQIKRGLKYCHDASVKTIRVMGMPTSDQTGHFRAVSILLWDKDTETWAYVPASSDAVLELKKQCLILLLGPPPLIADQPWEWFKGGNRTGPFPQRLETVRQEFQVLKNNHQFTKPPNTLQLKPERGKEFLGINFSDCLAGDIQSLRDVLVEIN